MQNINFPIIQDNEITHQQVKALMIQHKILDVSFREAFACISSQKIARIQYLLNPKTWAWILKYMQTGDYEDFGIVPSKVSNINSDFQMDSIKQLIEQGCNIVRVPFIRETEAFIKLIALFRYGKLIFSIRRNDDFMNYLSDNGL